jgi:hypothetical protein
VETGHLRRYFCGGFVVAPSIADPQAIGISSCLARRRTAWIFIENDSIEEMDCRNVS